MHAFRYVDQFCRCPKIHNNKKNEILSFGALFQVPKSILIHAHYKFMTFSLNLNVSPFYRHLLWAMRVDCVCYLYVWVYSRACQCSFYVLISLSYDVLSLWAIKMLGSCYCCCCTRNLHVDRDKVFFCFPFQIIQSQHFN